MPPPVVRVVIARFWLLLPDSVRRRVQKLYFTFAVRYPGSRSELAGMIRVTLHLRPLHAPTARLIV